jgi:adenylate cyclase
VDRKLAAILSADVVGYSRLMAEDEAATIGRLTAYREQIQALVRDHRGRVVDSPGDNILAEFPTALDAVRCSVEMQAVLRARNTILPAERRMEFRIGVHMGDVAVEGERVYGDGVNIAARLEGLADAGGICISATVHDQVRNKIDVRYSDLGDQTVKNIPEQVHVYRVQPPSVSSEPDRRAPARRRRGRGLAVAGTVILALVVALWATWPRPLGLVLDAAGVTAAPVEPPLPDKPSVVVLPFDNMSADAGHFADGITEELTANLAGNPSLFVISRSSAFSYKGQRIRAEEVGRELGVRYVVEGSVRRADDRVRITAQLIDAMTGVHVWSRQYDRELEDIFAVQSEISEAILGAVGAEVREAELLRIRRRPTTSLTAYEAYTRAFSHFIRMTRHDIAEARTLLEQAISIDPAYVDSYSLLGSTYAAEYSLGWNLDESLLDRATELANRSLELDPTFPGPYVTLASVNLSAGRPDKVIALAKKAIELAPSFAAPRFFLAIGQAQKGQTLAALQTLKLAVRLEPRASEFGAFHAISAAIAWQTGRVEEAVAYWERAREMNADLIFPRVSLADYYVSVDRLDKARLLLEEIRRVNPDLTAEGAGALARRFGRTPEQAVALGENLRRVGLPSDANPSDG